MIYNMSVAWSSLYDNFFIKDLSNASKILATGIASEYKVREYSGMDIARHVCATPWTSHIKTSLCHDCFQQQQQPLQASRSNMQLLFDSQTISLKPPWQCDGIVYRLSFLNLHHKSYQLSFSVASCVLPPNWTWHCKRWNVESHECQRHSSVWILISI